MVSPSRGSRSANPFRNTISSAGAARKSATRISSSTNSSPFGSRHHDRLQQSARRAERIQNFCRDGPHSIRVLVAGHLLERHQEHIGRKASGRGHLIGLVYERLERAVAAPVGRVFAITGDFLPQLSAWGIAADRISGDRELGRRRTRSGSAHATMAGARSKVSATSKLVLYTGTLGLKHNPELILAAARKFAAGDDDVKIVVPPKDRKSTS